MGLGDLERDFKVGLGHDWICCVALTSNAKPRKYKAFNLNVVSQELVVKVNTICFHLTGTLSSGYDPMFWGLMMNHLHNYDVTRPCVNRT